MTAFESQDIQFVLETFPKSRHYPIAVCAGIGVKLQAFLRTSCSQLHDFLWGYYIIYLLINYLHLESWSWRWQQSNHYWAVHCNSAAENPYQRNSCPVQFVVKVCQVPTHQQSIVDRSLLVPSNPYQIDHPNEIYINRNLHFEIDYFGRGTYCCLHLHTFFTLCGFKAFRKVPQLDTLYLYSCEVI